MTDDVIEFSIGDLSTPDLNDVEEGTTTKTKVTIVDSNRQALRVAFGAASYSTNEQHPDLATTQPDAAMVMVTLILPADETAFRTGR